MKVRESIVKEEGKDKYKGEQIVPTIVGKNINDKWLIMVIHGCQITYNREYKFEYMGKC